MTTQMIIRLDLEIKSKITAIARNEGKTASQVIRELIEDYIKERDISSYIDDLWNRIGDKLSLKGVEIKDIKKTIDKVRAGNK